MTQLRTVIGITLILFLISSNSFSADRTFRGKLIDAETLKPIEGAVVVAVWMKTKAFLIDSTTDFKDAKETLTDKNGEWSITGPEGYKDPSKPGILYYLGVYVTESPDFIYYKPGYRGNTRGGFSAYPYIDKERDLEGIVLNRLGETWEEIRKQSEQFPRDSIRFIPAKNPEKKLRDLDFSFQYPDNLQIIQRRTKYVRANYVVKGFKKAKTREERLRAMNSCSGWGLPMVSNMKREEREKLLGPVRRKKK